MHPKADIETSLDFERKNLAPFGSPNLLPKFRTNFKRHQILPMRLKALLHDSPGAKLFHLDDFDYFLILLFTNPPYAFAYHSRLQRIKERRGEVDADISIPCSLTLLHFGRDALGLELLHPCQQAIWRAETDYD